MKQGIFVRLFSYGLRLGLFFLAITSAGVLVFGSPDTLKTSLETSGAYTTASDRLARQAGNAAENQAGKAVDRASIEVAAQQSFSPQVIQTSTEKVIQDTYAWLDGTTAEPKIALDLSPFVNQFAQSLGDQATERVESLPACSLEQLRQINPNNISPYELPCRPPGIDMSTAKQQVIDQAIGSSEFLKNPVISSDSLPKDEQGRTALDRAENLPQIYQLAMLGPWLFGGLTALCAGLLMWLLRSSGWREGLRKIGRSLLGVGIALLIIIAITKLFFHFVTASDGIASKLADGDFQEVVITFIKSLEHAYSGKLLVFGVVYAVAAVVMLVIIRLRKPTAPMPQTVAADPVGAGQTPTTPTSTPPSSTPASPAAAKETPIVDKNRV